MVLRCAPFARGSSAERRFITFLQRFVQFVSRRALKANFRPTTRRRLSSRRIRSSEEVPTGPPFDGWRSVTTDYPRGPRCPFRWTKQRGLWERDCSRLRNSRNSIYCFMGLLFFPLRTRKNAFAKNQLQRRFLEVLSLEGYCTDYI